MKSSCGVFSANTSQMCAAGLFGDDIIVVQTYAGIPPPRRPPCYYVALSRPALSLLKPFVTTEGFNLAEVWKSNFFQCDVPNSDRFESRKRNKARRGHFFPLPLTSAFHFLRNKLLFCTPHPESSIPPSADRGSYSSAQ